GGERDGDGSAGERLSHHRRPGSGGGDAGASCVSPGPRIRTYRAQVGGRWSRDRARRAGRRAAVNPITIAVPKGRIRETLLPLLRKAGVDCSCLERDDRTLVRTTDDGELRFLLLKPDDVPTYVESGVADLGISGRDTLLERGYHLYQLVDLGIGKCRMAVAALEGAELPDVPRVATKYPNIALRHYAGRGIQPEVIYLQGSVELGPIVGL